MLFHVGSLRLQNCVCTALYCEFVRLTKDLQSQEKEITLHSMLSKNLIKSQSLWMEPLQGERALLGGPEYVLVEHLANGA